MASILQALFNGRMLVVFLFGVSSGIPLLLIGGTLKAWMKESHVDLTLIGIYSLAGLPYTLKFLWSPLMDRYTPPFLGRRRGWILICQMVLAISFAQMAFIDPALAPIALACLAFIIAFFSASQDIVIDAYRREVLKEEELGLGSSLAVNGYRVALLITGAGAFALADHIPWKGVYLVMAAIMAAGTLLTFFSPEPERNALPPRTLKEAVVLPLVDYFKRSHAIEILFFVLVFKIGDSMASEMFNPFYLDLGYTKTQIAAIGKLFGFWATIVGGLIGGLAMVKLGVFRSLWIFGFLQAFSTLGFSVLASIGNSLGWLTSVVVFENLSSGMGTSAYIAFMAKLCNTRFTATQYALLSSLAGVPRVIFGSSSGYLAKHLGWTGYFLFCTFLSIPGLLLLLRRKRWTA